MGLGNIGNYMDENWHGGQLEGDFFDHPSMDIEENAKVDKPIKQSVWNWKHAFTRELMRGKHKFEIINKYLPMIIRFDIHKQANDFLDKNDGALGYFIVDVSNFDDKFSYEDMPEDLRKCNLYAVNSTELREVINRALVSENDGSMDGFLNSNDNVDEEITYLDECTGLPCIDSWDGESDDEDERLNNIASLFLGKKWMTLDEFNKFNTMEGKLPYLVSIVKRAFAPKSRSNGKFKDDVNDYDVKDQDLQADSQKEVKEAEVNNIHETTMDDVGYVAMPQKYDIKHENKKSDYQEDVSFNKKRDKVEVNNIHESEMDDIGNTDMPDKVDIKREHKKSDYQEDVDFDKEFETQDVDNDTEIKFDEINTEVPDYGKVNDNMTELKNKDYQDDIYFDNISDFVVEDNVSDMLDEMLDEDADKNEIEYEEKPQEIEISEKYDWGW